MGGILESMSVASGCGCIRRYISFLILLIPIYIHSSCICSFLQQHPYFLFIFKIVFRSCLCYFCNFIIKNYC